MKRLLIFLLNFLNKFLKFFNLIIIKQSVSTNRVNISKFVLNGSEREWRQYAMYCCIFNEIRDIPGDILEFGVAGGTSITCFGKLNKIFNDNRSHRLSKKIVHGFDTFEGLPYFDKEKDTPKKVIKDMSVGGFNSNEEYYKLKKITKQIGNIKLYKGTFEHTLPKFLKEHNHMSFSLIHIDCDLHKSTVAALKDTIYLLNVGGVILFDEIFHENFPGETSGFWEVYNNLIKKNKNLTLEFKRVHSMPWKWYAVRTR